MSTSKRWVAAVAGALLLAAFIVPIARTQDREHGGRIRHVLLISIDGMHALDFINCSKGISGANGGKPGTSSVRKPGPAVKPIPPVSCSTGSRSASGMYSPNGTRCILS